MKRWKQWRNRRAARRMLDVLMLAPTAVKTEEELITEIWLWHQIGRPDIARALRVAWAEDQS